MSKIHLRLTGPVCQRNEYLAVPLRETPDSFFYLGIAAGVAIFGAQSLEDTLGGMALFLVDVLVALQDLLDAVQKRPYLRLFPITIRPVARRLTMGEYFLEGFPVNTLFFHHLALGYPFYQDFLANFDPLIHIVVHSFSFRCL